MSQSFLPFNDDEHSSHEVENEYLGIPGLRYCARFLDSTAQATIVREVDALPWQGDLKRRVQHYGYKYDYKARRVDPSMFVGELPPFAIRTGKRLVDFGLLPKMPDQVIVNEYVAGQGIAPHIDCEPCFHDYIATVSLGAVYKMDLTEATTGSTHVIPLELGSCLVFSGPARYDWKHGIKARKTENGVTRGRRVSLTYRTVILSEEHANDHIR